MTYRHVKIPNALRLPIVVFVLESFFSLSVGIALQVKPVQTRLMRSK
jgi:hypothetical protein